MATSRKEIRNGIRHAHASNTSLPKYVRVAMITNSDTTIPRVGEVCRGTVSVLAAKQATSVIPIVFAGGDPVGTGLVVSLAPPGGNVTGLSLQQTDLAGKRLE